MFHMKKIKLPFFSFVVSLIIAISTSSFSMESDTKIDTSYYWYRVNSSGQITSSSIQFGGIKRTQAEADANDMCNGIGQDCLRGFEIQPTSFPNSLPGDAVTTKN